MHVTVSVEVGGHSTGVRSLLLPCGPGVELRLRGCVTSSFTDFCLFYAHGCFICMYCHVMHACLMPVAAIRESQAVVISDCWLPCGAGDWSQVLWKSSY